MNKEIDKNKPSIAAKDTNNSKVVINKQNNLENIKKSKYGSPNKKYTIFTKRIIRINSFSSSHNNKNYSLGAKALKKKILNSRLNMENKKSNINNLFHKNNKCSSSISKGKKNNINTSKISKNNSKNAINNERSPFQKDLTKKYKRNSNIFNISLDSLNKTKLTNKTNYINSKNIKTNSQNILKNLKKEIKNNNRNNINNIKGINMIEKNNKEIKQFYSINTLSTPYNMNKYNNDSHSRKYNSKNRLSSVSNHPSKEKKNINKKLDKIKFIKHQKLIKKSEYLCESSKNSISKNILKTNINKKTKQINTKINSRNVRYLNCNMNNIHPLGNKSAIVNLNNKKTNFVDINQKYQKVLSNKRNFGKYNTSSHSPNNALNRNDFLNLLDISKILQENNIIKEKNNSLSIQINDMTKEFENIKKENIIIKKELQEKSKMIKDMKLTIDIFNQELNKLHNLAKRVDENDNNLKNNNFKNIGTNIYQNLKDKKV